MKLDKSKEIKWKKGRFKRNTKMLKTNSKRFSMSKKKQKKTAKLKINLKALFSSCAI